MLLCQRLHPTSGAGRRAVQTVQGGIDPGETPEDAAARELREELGITKKEYAFIGQAPGAFRYDWPEAYLHSLPEDRRTYVGQEIRFFLARIRPDTVFHLDAHDQEFSRVWWDTPLALIDLAWIRKKPGIEAALRHFGLL